MTLLGRDFWKCAGTVLVVVAMFLLVPAHKIQAQGDEATSPSNDSQPVVTRRSPANALPMPENTDRLTQQKAIAKVDRRVFGNEDTRQLFLAEPLAAASRPTPQGSTKSSYVFPTGIERFKRYVRDMIGPFSLIGIGAAAGIDQWNDSPPEWGQGGSGYGKRYASNLGQNAIQQTVSYGLSEALRLDTGFHKSTRNGFGPRLADALVQNVTSRTRSGMRVISAPRLAGFYVGGIVPDVTWYPSRFSYKDGLRDGTYSLAAGFAVNVVREFIFHK